MRDHGMPGLTGMIVARTVPGLAMMKYHIPGVNFNRINRVIINSQFSGGVLERLIIIFRSMKGELSGL